jgi:RND family efflux transporter MFP subunit
MTLRALDLIRQTVGPENVEISTSFIGVQPASYPINTIYLWTSGPQESVLSFAVKPAAKLRGDALKEELRARFAKAMPDVRISFEAGDIVGRVMSFGADTPIEVAVQGPSMPANREHAKKVYAELAKVRRLRDLQLSQPLDYPVLQIDVDRDRAGQLGLTVASVARSLVAATSSSRFIDPNYWRDPNSGNAFQIQVEIPQHRVQSIEDVRAVPVGARGQTLLGDVAEVKPAQAFGLVERYNMQRVVSMTANVHGSTVGEISDDVRKAVRAAGEPPRGVTVAVRGQIPPLEETISGLQTGLLLAAGTIFLLLVANFQSVRLGFAVLSTLPAAVVGAILMLLATGTTLNVQSFMGAIMASGIAVANSILLVTFAEMARQDGREAHIAAVEGGSGRLRAVLMTAAAMIAGMIPLALASNETAPLARAVIGGLVLATFSTLFVLPSVYAILQSRARRGTISLHPAVVLLVVALGLNAQPVEVARVETRSASRTVGLSGEFTPYQAVDIHARVAGFVEKVLVDRGSGVRQGQLLATLSAPEMDAQQAEAEARASVALSRVREASARLASVQATYDRLKAASATPGAISGQELTTSEQSVAEARAAVTSAEAAHTAARAAVEAVNKLRQYLNLRAPFDGVVTERYAHPGALAGPSAGPMLKLEQVGRLRLVVSVPEAYYAGVARGQRIPFRVAAYPGREFHGSVARLAPAMDPKSRTMPVELDVPNARRELAPGMYADVTWPVRTGKASLLVPATAVATTTERTFVIRVNTGRAEWVDVRKGARFENDVEVIGSVRAGDTVVLRASDEIREGSAVNRNK